LLRTIRGYTRFLRNDQKEDELGILDTVLRRREPAAAFRTIDGGHPAPYPDMTDEQLYNYEIAFNVPKKTFDSPPRSPVRSSHATGFDPEFESFGHAPIVRESRAPEKQSAASHAPEQPAWQQDMPDRTPSFSQPASHEARPQQRAHQETHEEAHEAAHEAAQPQAAADDSEHAEPPLWTEHEQVWTSRIPLGEGRPLDLSKPVRTITTRQPVEIITAKARHPIYKVHGYIGDDEIATVFTLDGRLSENSAQFLENVPEEHQLYLNIYPNHNGYGQDRYVITQHGTREEADVAATAGRIACVRADFDL
jgi:hypothetical protein